jgi:hypothetical protein
VQCDEAIELTIEPHAAPNDAPTHPPTPENLPPVNVTPQTVTMSVPVVATTLADIKLQEAMDAYSHSGFQELTKFTSSELASLYSAVFPSGSDQFPNGILALGKEGILVQLNLKGWPPLFYKTVIILTPQQRITDGIIDIKGNLRISGRLDLQPLSENVHTVHMQGFTANNLH